jgi:hypothetical protein
LIKWPDISEVAVRQIGWGNDWENQRIVDTFLKHDPREMLNLLCENSRIKKSSFIKSIRRRTPHIEDDVESLSAAVDAVIEERRHHWAYLKKQPFPDQNFPRRHGGILDFGPVKLEKLRVLHDGDGGTGLSARVPPHMFRPMVSGLLEAQWPNLDDLASW